MCVIGSTVVRGPTVGLSIPNTGPRLEVIWTLLPRPLGTSDDSAVVSVFANWPWCSLLD
jgi:hypothetical protein